MLFILSNGPLYDVCEADPNEKVINRAKKLNNGNEVGKAKEFLLTSFVNETNGTVLDVPNKSIKYAPWDLLSKRNIEHLQRLIMKPNLLPKHLHDFQTYIPYAWCMYSVLTIHWRLSLHSFF